MKVRVLGCSGAISKDCRTTSFLVDQDVLIDAGTGVGDLTLDEMLSIDHVLLDEAQDSNPAQWGIVRALTAEFFAGEGAAEAARSVFAVGDVKQSIFSFQGADPAGFFK